MMSTNFYCRRIDQASRDKLKIQFNKLHSDLIESIDNIETDYRQVIDNFLLGNENLEQEIHLGRMSYGWQFLWDYHNGIYFQPTLESIKKFLSQDGITIYDEYGRKFTLEQFIDEIRPSLYKDRNHQDGMNSNCGANYFINDGLRFSKFEDFS